MKYGIKHKKTSADSTENPPTATLFEAIRDGDDDAFARYYLTSFDRLVTLIRRTVKDNEEAKNIAQDTLVKLWEQRERIDPTQSLDSFVSKMAWNTGLNFLKKQQVHVRYHNEQLYLRDKEDLGADERFVARQTAECIEAAVRRMPPQRRRVYELSRNENLTYDQIAKRMNLSRNVVRNYMAAALEHLRSALSMTLLFLLCIVR
jgi:RNA polymerase sigma-70 factor (ECF subfamily)